MFGLMWNNNNTAIRTMKWIKDVESKTISSKWYKIHEIDRVKKTNNNKK